MATSPGVCMVLVGTAGTGRINNGHQGRSTHSLVHFLASLSVSLSICMSISISIRIRITTNDCTINEILPFILSWAKYSHGACTVRARRPIFPLWPMFAPKRPPFWQTCTASPPSIPKIGPQVAHTGLPFGTWWTRVSACYQLSLQSTVCENSRLLIPAWWAGDTPAPKRGTAH